MQLSSSSPIKHRSHRGHSLLSVGQIHETGLNKLWTSRFKSRLLKPPPTLKQLDSSGNIDFEREELRQGRPLQRGFILLDRLIGKSNSPEVSPERTINIQDTEILKKPSSSGLHLRKASSQMSNKQRLRVLLDSLDSGKRSERSESEKPPLTDIERVVNLRLKGEQRHRKARTFRKPPMSTDQSLNETSGPSAFESKQENMLAQYLHSLRGSAAVSKLKEVVLVTNLPKLPFGKHSTYNRDDLGSCFKKKVCKDWFSVNNSRRRSPSEELPFGFGPPLAKT